jgi:hypothetical protein
VLPDHTAQYNMTSTKRWFTGFMQGCSEEQRWNGRTQSFESRSPEQLRHDRRQSNTSATPQGG